MKQILFDSPDTLIISIVVLFIGNQLTSRISILERYSIPQAVTGGLLVSLLVLSISMIYDTAIVFNMNLRDILLLTFFSTIGLSAKFKRLKAGGRPLVIMVVCAAVFLIIQNGTGVLIALFMGIDPGYGLFAGSVSFAGGHGTAIAWGQEAEAAGLVNAELLGIAFATFGLVAGGIMGGPIGESLIKKHKLKPKGETDNASMMAKQGEPTPKAEPVTTQRILTTIFILAICVSFGEIVNKVFFNAGVKLPGFLTAMMVGIIITNGADVFKKNIRQRDFDRVGDIALQLFLSMSLMSLNLLALTGAMRLVVFVLFAQVMVITLFATQIVFRLLGKNYDAAVISSGFMGLGLGATPVAIANMNAITSKYGPSFKAFLVIPLVGAFFVDLINALVIKFFIGLPFLQVSF